MTEKTTTIYALAVQLGNDILTLDMDGVWVLRFANGAAPAVMLDTRADAPRIVDMLSQAFIANSGLQKETS